LQVVQQNVIYVDHVTPTDTLTGYCFDANANEPLTITATVLSGNVSLFLAVSPFDNPTNFLAVQRGTADPTPVFMSFTPPAPGRYLLIVQDIGGETQQRTEPPTGDFGFVVTNALLPAPVIEGAI